MPFYASAELKLFHFNICLELDIIILENRKCLTIYLFIVKKLVDCRVKKKETLDRNANAELKLFRVKIICLEQFFDISILKNKKGLK